MVNEIKSIIVENTKKIDELISIVLKKSKTAPYTTFQQKLEKFGDIKHVTNLDRAKFKVYAKINKDLCNDHNSDSVCKMSLNYYYPFLINLYANEDSNSDNSEKFKRAIHNFVVDMQNVVKYYANSSLDYAQISAEPIN
ncbi:hypothetical protein MWU59_04600 [Flavobacteriaceae bacterium F08102]|nr:hypothetical protein [Flavobacteriaceae bacterium F08102]